MKEQTYVYDGREVVPTGRTAEKEMRSNKVKTLYEVRPVNADPEDRTMNKWVSLDDLYKIAG